MPIKPMERLTESMFYVLMALQQAPMCGIDVVAFLDRRSRGRIQMGPATLYTILGKFERARYIEETAVEGRKRSYRITGRGRKAYEDELRRLRQCLADAEGKEVQAHE